MAPFASFHGTAMSMAKSAQANPGLRTTMIKDRTITAATLALQCILHSLCNRWRVNVPESISTGGVTGQALPDSTELPFLDSCTDWSEEEALDGAVALSRLLRNLCVEGEVAQCALQEHRSLDVLLEAARAAISAAGNRSGLHDKGELFLVAVLQALGNAVVNCNGNRRALWEKAWPDPLLKCALQNTACKGIVGMIVYQCLQAIPDETVRDFARSEEASNPPASAGCLIRACPTFDLLDGNMLPVSLAQLMLRPSACRLWRRQARYSMIFYCSHTATGSRPLLTRRSAQSRRAPHLPCAHIRTCVCLTAAAADTGCVGVDRASPCVARPAWAAATRAPAARYHAAFWRGTRRGDASVVLFRGCTGKVLPGRVLCVGVDLLGPPLRSVVGTAG
jgi:hypothetical protein